MGNLWTPPRGFFPSALSWFHPGNIDRFQPIFRSDSECGWNLMLFRIYDFGTPCDGSAIGKPVHIWKGDPPDVEDWGTVTACHNGDYECDDLTLESVSDCKVTIGTGTPATLNDLWRGGNYEAPYGSASAIRYGWLFSDKAIEWWLRGYAVHWLGPPP